LLDLAIFEERSLYTDTMTKYITGLSGLTGAIVDITGW